MQICSRPVSGVRLPVHNPQHRRSVQSRLVLVRAEAATAQEAPTAGSDGAKKAKVEFHVPHHVEFGEEMCLVGATEEMGAWKAEECIPMAWHDGDVWTAEADVPAGTRVEYKYIVRHNGSEEVEWQPCNNLQLELPEQLPEEKPVVVQDSWEGEQHSVLVGDSELVAPALDVAAVEGNGAAEAKAVAAAAEEEQLPAAVAEEGKAAVAAEAAVEEPRAAGPVMDALSAAVTDDMPLQGVEEAVAARAAKVAAAAVDANSKASSGKEPVVAAAATAGAAAGKRGAKEQAANSDGLDDMDMTEIRAACKAAGVNAVSGRRRDLITRLREKRASEGMA